VDDALVLFTLRFADELVDAGSLSFPTPKLKGQELAMAKSLVQTLAGDWVPDKYTDDYRDNLMRLIKAKAKGRSIELTPEERPRPANVVDLMERLRRSLEQSGARGKRRRATSRTKATSRTRRSARKRAA
jgi:DNA end-binding protein Ku